MDGSPSALISAVAEFLRTGRARLPLATSHIVPRVIAAVAKLIQDPARDAWGLYVPRPAAEPGDKDDGLIRRSQQYVGDPTTDNKWFFHFRLTLKKDLEAAGVDTSGHEDLFDACQELFTINLGGALAFADAYDLQAPGLDLKHRLLTAVEPHVLRVLFYDQGAMMARPHIDRDALTLHVAESRPGLRIGPERERYVTSPDEALIFPGRKFAELTGGKVPALLHDVLDDSVGAITNEQRWSIVFFTHT